MIEERIIDWLDFADNIQKIDLYEKPKLLKYFQYHHNLLKYGVNSETFDIFVYILYFLQLICLSTININGDNDIILQVFKYFEKIILPHEYYSFYPIFIMYNFSL